MRKYSIIMPVYNASKTIHKSIESVINQTYGDWELLLIDDGSSDNSYEIIKNYEKNDERIKGFHQENGGPGRARNLGISKISGDYVLFIDSDDYYENNLLELVNNKIHDTHADLIYISMINEDDKCNIKNIIDVGKFNGYTKKDYLDMEIMGVLPWGPCSKIVKKEIAEKTKFSNLAVGEEIIYSYELINRSDNIIFLDVPLYHYVHNENGQHTKGGNDPWHDVVNIMTKYLKENDYYMNHVDAVKCLSLKGLLISVYRISVNNNIKTSILMIKEKHTEYLNDFKIDKFSKKFLDKKSVILYYLLKYKLYFLLVLLSKLRKK